MSSTDMLGVLCGVFEFSPIPTVVTAGLEGPVLCMNRQFIELFGYGPEEIKSVSDWWSRAYPDPDYRERLRREWLNRSSASGSEKRPISSAVTEVTCKDGSVRHCSFHLRAAHGLSIVSMIDLTEHRRAEEAFRTSEEKHRALFELESDALFLIDNTTGEILEANAAAGALYGYPCEQLVGMNHTQLSVEPTETRMAALAGRTEVPLRWHRKRDGTVLPVEITASHIDWHGRSTHIAAIRDITERERSRASLEESATQLRRALDATVGALAATVELRDPYTAGHQRRVAELACAIAAKLGWAEHTLETLRIAALLHDIGKITVPSEILARPGRLTEVEMSLIHRHAGVGAGIVADIPFRAPVADMIGQHHERLDGSGYPRGLREPDILPGARILAVADVLEAMQSHRPYRAALGLDAALEFVSANAGSLFDAEVVAACQSIVREGFELLP